MSRCDQNGPPARREEGAYPKPYVTDEQRSRRPIFIATLRAAAGWLFFLRRGGSLRIKSRYTRRSRLEKQPTDRRRNIHVFRGQDTYRSVYSSLLPCSEGISRTGFRFRSRSQLFHVLRKLSFTEIYSWFRSFCFGICSRMPRTETSSVFKIV